MMIVAIIPARGGSKRIPRKNVRPFAGKPIIAYSIEAARASGLFDRIVVSTDDSEIAAVARQLGAETPFIRAAELADDYTGTNEVVADALRRLAQQGAQPAFACCIYATAPFVTSEVLKRGYALLVESGRQFVFGATCFEFPVQRAIRILPDGGVAPMFPEWIESRSQDLEPAYHDAGQFYWGRTEAFCENVSVFAAHSSVLSLPRSSVLDIDTPEDWAEAEKMYLAHHESR